MNMEKTQHIYMRQGLIVHFLHNILLNLLAGHTGVVDTTPFQSPTLLSADTNLSEGASLLD